MMSKNKKIPIGNIFLNLVFIFIESKGGGKMTQNELLDLKRKVDQHEQTIVQLLEIIAATNRRLSELSAVQSP
jgi:hypothetical protein